MDGHHEVQFFDMPGHRGEKVSLPPGWKPFAVIAVPGQGFYVVARKWVRTEKEVVAHESRGEIERTY